MTSLKLSEAFDAWRKKKSDLGEEIADIMIYIFGLAKMLNVDLENELVAKIEIAADTLKLACPLRPERVEKAAQGIAVDRKSVV